RVKCNHSVFHIIAAHKIAIYIVEYLIAVYIAVVVWGGNRKRMPVVQTRYKRADNKFMRFESLVYRRWLMNASYQWFEIMNTKAIGEIISVPTNDIEWVCGVCNGV